MASLLPYADAVMHQRLLLSSSHEKLARQLADLQATRNRQCLSLPDKLAAVESESDDLVEQRDRKQRLVGELAQYRLELHTRALCLTGATKKRDAVRDFFAQAEATWAGYPSQIVHVARALQERRALLKETAPFVVSLSALSEQVQLRTVVTAQQRGSALYLTAHAAHLDTQSAALQKCVEAEQARATEVTARRAVTHTAHGSVADAALLADRVAVEAEAELALAQLTGDAVGAWRTALKEMAQSWADRLSAQATVLEQEKENYDTTLSHQTSLATAIAQLAANQEQTEQAHKAADTHNQHALTEAQQAVSTGHAQLASLAERTKRAGETGQQLSGTLRGALQMMHIFHMTQKELFAASAAENASSREATQVRLDALRRAHEAHLAAKCRERHLARCRQSLAALEGEEALKRRSYLQEEATEWMHWQQRQREGRETAQAAQRAREATEALTASQKPPTRGTKRGRGADHVDADNASLADALGLPKTRVERRRAPQGATTTTAASSTTTERTTRRDRKRARPPMAAFSNLLQSTSVASAAAQTARKPATRPAHSASPASEGASDGGAASQTAGGAQDGANASFDSTEDTITVTKACRQGGDVLGAGASADPSPSPAPRTPTRVRAGFHGSHAAAAARLAAPRARRAAGVFDQGPLPRATHPHATARMNPPRSLVAASVVSGGALSHALGRTAKVAPSARTTHFGPLRPTVVEKRISQTSSAESGDNIFKDFFSCT